MSGTNGKAHDTLAGYEYRHKCGRVMFRGVLPVGTRIRMRCPRCRLMYYLHIVDPGDTRLYTKNRGRVDVA